MPAKKKPDPFWWWQRGYGYEPHEYYLGTERIGIVCFMLRPTDGYRYSWMVEMPELVGGGEAKTLRTAKRMVEKTVRGIRR